MTEVTQPLPSGVAGETRAQKIAHYWKTIVAVLGAVILVGNQVSGVVIDGYGDGMWNEQDTITVAFALMTALGVYFKSNRPTGKDGVMHADLSDPSVDRYNLELNGPPENLVGQEFLSLRVEKKV